MSRPGTGLGDSGGHGAIATPQTERPRPATTTEVDGGRAWIVAGACFFSLFASVGFSIGGIGVATVSFRGRFNESTNEELGWIGGLRNFQFLASPLAVVLIKLFGCRVTSIAGTLVSAAAIACSALSGELWHAYLLYSVAAGIGVSLTYTSTFNILGQRFEKKRNLVFSLVALGNALGIVVFPYLLQTVVDRLGHESALYITAALKVIELVTGGLFSSPPRDASGDREKDAFNMEAIPKTTERLPDAKTEQSGASSPLEKVARTPESPTTDEEVVSEIGVASEAKGTELSGKQKTTGSSAALGMLSVLGHWQAVLLLLHAFCFGYALVAVEALMPLYVTRKGVDADDAALGITLIGVGFLVVAVALLAAGAREFDRFVIYIVASAVIGACTVAMTASDAVAAYLSLCGLFGLAMGAALSLFMSVLVSFGDSLGDAAHLFGMYQFAKGAGSVCGPVVTGLIQTQSSDDIGWYASTGVGLLSAVALVPLLVSRRRSRARDLRSGDASTGDDEMRAGAAGKGAAS